MGKKKKAIQVTSCFFGPDTGVFFKIIVTYQHLKIGRFDTEVQISCFCKIGRSGNAGSHSRVAARSRGWGGAGFNGTPVLWFALVPALPLWFPSQAPVGLGVGESVWNFWTWLAP